MKAQRPIIAVDIDDVLSLSAPAFIAYSNNRWGTTFTLADYHDDWARLWNYDRANIDELALVRERGAELLKATMPELEHYEEAYDVLKKLKEQYSLVIVTARRLQQQEVTLAWLNARFPGIFEDEMVHFTGFFEAKDQNTIKLTKGKTVKQLKASYLIDDQPRHCNSALEEDVQAVLFGDHGWHDMEPVLDGVVRARNWQEVLEFFNAERKRVS